MAGYEIPAKSINWCKGQGPEYGYCQHKIVCWTMKRHTGRHGCKNCPNNPQDLGIQITPESLRVFNESDWSYFDRILLKLDQPPSPPTRAYKIKANPGRRVQVKNKAYIHPR